MGSVIDYDYKYEDIADSDDLVQTHTINFDLILSIFKKNKPVKGSETDG